MSVGERRWYLARGKQKVGPLTAGELRGLAGRGELTPADLVLPEGASRWLPAGDDPELFPPAGGYGDTVAPTPSGADAGTTAPAESSDKPPESTLSYRPEETTAQAPAARGSRVAVAGYEVLGELGRGG